MTLTRSSANSKNTQRHSLISLHALRISEIVIFTTWILRFSGTTSRLAKLRFTLQRVFDQKLRILAILFSFSFFQTIHAEPGPPPKYVYRVDERGPEDIFANGFSPWGRNDYLLAHVLGTSLLAGSGERSYFVATTATLEAAYLIARSRYEHGEQLRNRQFFIYEIRADQHFFDVDRYMENLERNPPEGENRQMITEARRAYRYQNEWVAAGPIRPEQVRWARRVAFNNGAVIDVDQNPVLNNNGPHRFVDVNTHANEDIYPRLGVNNYHRVLGQRAFALNGTVDFLRGVTVSLAYCRNPVKRSVVEVPVVHPFRNRGCDGPTIIDLAHETPSLQSVYMLLLDENDDALKEESQLDLPSLVTRRLVTRHGPTRRASEIIRTRSSGKHRNNFHLPA